jgi:hypothetical protein
VEGRSSDHRRTEALVTSYVQRYCTKNDTIGFFGPVGWARQVDDGALLRAEPGPGLLASRTAYFEGWAVDTLGQALAGDEALLPWLAPRRMPYLRIEGRVLRPPLAAPVALTPAEAAALELCDGERTARQLAALLLADPELGLAGERQVLDVLRRLRDAHWIAWTLEVPAEGLRPEDSLRRLLARVGDEPRRTAALAALDELVDAGRAVGAAAGDADAVDRAVEALEGTFTRLTAAEPTRRQGQMRAGRTLVYEDSRRDIDVRLGPGLSETLGPPLSLVLDAARWHAAEAASLFRAAFRDIHARLAGASGAAVPFASFWFLAHPLIFGENAVVDALTERLRQRWRSVLGDLGAERRVVLDVEELRPRVAAAFATERGAWASAPYHSPDLMIAGASADAVSAGRFQYVLGEVHPTVNTLRPAFFSDQHPNPDELLRAAERDLPEPQVVSVYARAQGGATLRIHRSLVSPKDYRFVWAPDTCGVPPARALVTGDLDVVAAGDGLEVTTRGGGRRFDVLDVLSDLLSLRLIHSFEIGPPADHTPRISFGPLVVCRESWRFARGSLAFAGTRGERERFLEVRRWRRDHGMPRFVFVRTRTGRKPFFVDFDSPLSIDVLARALRQVAPDAPGDPTVGVSEMLPAPDELWVRDARGRTYTSELRMVALEGRSSGVDRGER